jgi:hypothetical protein
MGKLVYGESFEVQFDDRPLAHLQIVIGAKLRRRESFFFSWRDEGGVEGGGRSSLWLDTAIPLVFRYNDARMPAINRHWLEILSVSANSSQGLQLTAEPEASAETESGS